MIDPGLQDKVALIAGANRGIGAATVRMLALHSRPEALPEHSGLAHQGVEARGRD